MTLAEGWSRTHPSPFKGGWGGVVVGVITERIYLTHITEGSLPLLVRATWQHCKTSQRFWEPQCGSMCLRALWQSQARFIAQHTNGLPGFILQLREGLSLEMISCLEQLTRQTTTRLASPYFLHTAAKWWKKKYTYIKTIGNKLSCSSFFCAGGGLVIMTLQEVGNMVLLLFFFYWKNARMQGFKVWWRSLCAAKIYFIGKKRETIVNSAGRKTLLPEKHAKWRCCDAIWPMRHY